MGGESLQCDVVVLTVIGPELHAVQDALDVNDLGDRIREEGDLYWRANVKSSLCTTLIRILIYCIGEAGEKAATAAATKLIERCNPAFVVLAGIAAGRRKQIKIGDVAVSRGIVDHSAGVATEGVILRRIWAPTVPHQTKQMLQAFRCDATKHAELSSSLFDGVLAPPPGQEAEYEEHVTVRPAVHDCHVATSDVLLRDSEILEGLGAEVHQGIRVGEMEAGGVVQACQNRAFPTPWLVIRGVSDFGDKFKNNAFHKLASCAAAAYLKLFLENGFDLALVRLDIPRPEAAGPPPCGEPATIVWPQPVDNFRPRLANRRPEFGDFKQVLAGKTSRRILLLQGPSNRGKTALLRALRAYCDRVQVPFSYVDLKGCPLIETVFHTIQLDIGPNLLPGFHTAESPDRGFKLLSDLKRLGEPLVLALDTYQDASDAIRMWVECQLLSQVDKTPAVTVVLCGHKLPEPSKHIWDQIANFVNLPKIRAVDDWLDYVHREVPDTQLTREQVEALTVVYDGNPGEISAAILTIANQFRSGISSQ